MTMYNWAVNKDKLNRAIKMAESKDEEKIKECYIKLGGLVVEPAKRKNKDAKKDND